MARRWRRRRRLSRAGRCWGSCYATAQPLLSAAVAIGGLTDAKITKAFPTERRGFPEGGPKKGDKVHVFGMSSEFRTATTHFGPGDRAHLS